MASAYGRIETIFKERQAEEKRSKPKAYWSVHGRHEKARKKLEAANAQATELEKQIDDLQTKLEEAREEASLAQAAFDEAETEVSQFFKEGLAAEEGLLGWDLPGCLVGDDEAQRHLEAIKKRFADKKPPEPATQESKPSQSSSPAAPQAEQVNTKVSDDIDMDFDELFAAIGKLPTDPVERKQKLAEVLNAASKRARRS